MIFILALLAFSPTFADSDYSVFHILNAFFKLVHLQIEVFYRAYMSHKYSGLKIKLYEWR